MATKMDPIAMKLLGILLANGGGFASTFGMNQLDTRIEVFRNNPALAPLLNDALAIGMLFLYEPSSPFAYGMMGASGGDFAGELVNGLSRIEVDSSSVQAELDDMEDGYSEDQETTEDINHEDVTDDDDDDSGDGT